MVILKGLIYLRNHKLFLRVKATIKGQNNNIESLGISTAAYKEAVPTLFIIAESDVLNSPSAELK